ncbi:MAG: lipopolysaccharide kinase InaA family protein [Planctomycetota bacterium]|jgi:hypothetical protein
MAVVALPPSLEETHLLRRRGRVALLLRRGWEQALPVDEMLAGAPLRSWGRPVPHSLRGRGEVHVLDTACGEIVAKRLQRGGVLGGFLRTWFADGRRPLREAEAAEQLARRDCRTPPIVAARVQRGLFGLCRIETATPRVVGAVDLLDALRGQSDAGALALAAGRTLRAAHDAGLHHRDLQAKNLLVPAGFPGPGGESDPEALLILDLDRCRVDASLDDAERVAALARLGRSLVKHRVLPRAPGEPSARALWVCRAFFRAYGPLGHDSAARALARVSTAVQRSVARHLLLWPEADRSGTNGPSSDVI